MFEAIVREALLEELHGFPIVLEHPESSAAPFVLMERTGSSENNHLRSCTIAFQSYGITLYKAAELNEMVKYAVKNLIRLPQIAKITLNSDYNFTNTETREYRYQAVFDFNYYDYY